MTVEEPHTFVAELGDLHDAALLALAWTPSDSTLALHIDDLYASFASPGLDDYHGPRAVVLLFSGVGDLALQTEVIEPEAPHIYRLEGQPTEDPGTYTWHLHLWPVGAATFTSASLTILDAT